MDEKEFLHEKDVLSTTVQEQIDPRSSSRAEVVPGVLRVLSSVGERGDSL